MSMLRNVKLRIMDLGLLILWFPVRIVIQHAPLKLVYFLATMVADCFYTVAGEIRTTIYRELSRCLGTRYTTKDIKRITKRSFEIYVKMHFENLLLGKLTKKSVERMVSVEGVEHLDLALSKGKGAIVLLSHFGSFLMVLPALGFMGYRINQLGSPPVLILKHHGLIHRIKEKAYSNLPVTFLRSDRALMPAIEALKKNEILAVAFDGREGRSWVPTRFLDQTFLFSPGPIKMAMITGAPILPTFIVRQKNNTQRLIIESPFEFEPMEHKKEFVSVNVRRLAKVFEQYILRYPCHYGMVLRTTRDREVDRPLFSLGDKNL